MTKRRVPAVPDPGRAVARAGDRALSEPCGARRVEGFTLVEVILAVVISAVIAAAIFGTLAAGRDASRRGEIDAELDQVARAALERIVTDLRFAVKPSETFDSGFIGAHEGDDTEARDRLDFITGAGLPDPYRMGSVDADDAERPRRADLSRVLYFIDDDETTLERGLVRAEQLVLTSATVQEDEDLDRIELATEAAALRFRYCLGTTWYDTWDSRQADALPQAVEVTLTVRIERNDEVHERTVKTLVRCFTSPPATQLDTGS